MNIQKNRTLAYLITGAVAWGPLLAAGEGFDIKIHRIHYADSERLIDFDFTAGEIDADGRLVLPSGAIPMRHWAEWDTDYVWRLHPGDATGVLDATGSGSYAFRFPELSSGQFNQRAGLEADGAVGDASGNWTWEVDLAELNLGEIGGDWLDVMIGGSKEAGITPRLRATIWEDEDGGFIYLEGSLMENGIFPVDSDFGFEFDPDLSSLSLRMVSDLNGKRLRTFYRLAGGDWKTLSEHELGEDQFLPGLFDQSMFVEVGVSHFPFLVVGNPDWEIFLSSFGYADVLNDLTPGFEGREYLSGEWGAAVGYVLAESGPVSPTWLEPHFLFPDWRTNSDFVEVQAIAHLDDEGRSSARSVIANDHLEITQTFEILDTIIGKEIGITPASEEGPGQSLRSNRHVLMQTYEIRNISGETITDLELFQFLHGLQSHTSLFDDRSHGGPLGDFRYATTQIGIDLGFMDWDDWDDWDWDDWDWDPSTVGGIPNEIEFEDYIAFWSRVPPTAFENGYFGIEGVDSHAEGKPSVGVHLSIEENDLDNTDYFAPETGWVGGAQRWNLGSLAPGETATFEVLLSISTGTRLSEDVSSGSANGGSTVPGGVDFSIPGITGSGAFFANFITADADEVNFRVGEGEFGTPDFPATGDLLQAWNLTLTAEFDGPALLTFGYDEELLAEGVNQTHLAIFYWNGLQWEPLESVVDPARNTIMAATDSFSWFALGVGDQIDNRLFSDSFEQETLNPVRWAQWRDEGKDLSPGDGRLEFVSTHTGHGVAAAAATSVFAIDESFRAKVTLEAPALSGGEGVLGLAVFSSATNAPGKPFGDFFLIGQSTGEWDGVPSGRKWVASNSIDNQRVEVAYELTGDTGGTLHVENDNGTFYLGFSGFGPEHALAVFTPNDWPEAEGVFIGLIGTSHQDTFSGFGTHFEEFSLLPPHGSGATVGFSAWANPINDPEARLPSFSAAGDGVSNLMRYALGVGPFDKVSDRLPKVLPGGDGKTRLSFRRGLQVENIVYEVEGSADLGDWFVIARSHGNAPFEDVEGRSGEIIETEAGVGFRDVTISESFFEDTAPRLFLRLRVVLSVD